MSGIVSVLLGESLLGLYSISVKLSQLSLTTQTWIRILIFCLFGALFSTNHLKVMIYNPTTWLLGFINLIHIYSSYIGFANLDAGVAMSIFYLYPIFNIIIKSLLTQTLMSINVIGNLMVSLLGVAILSINQIPSQLTWVGLCAMLLAALTESIMYMFFKLDIGHNPFNNLFRQHFSGVIIMGLGLLLFNQSHLLWSSQGLGLLIGMNLSFGIVGNLLRFWGLSQTTTEIYSSLSFTGVIVSYLVGWWMMNEPITLQHLIGTGLILISAIQSLKSI